jgi:hypothetical protein
MSIMNVSAATPNAVIMLISVTNIALELQY